MYFRSGTFYSGSGRSNVGIAFALSLVAVALVPTALYGAGTDDAVVVRVLENAADRIVLEYEMDVFASEPVMIDGTKYAHISLGDEAPMKELVGAPELPWVCRSIIIPDDAHMAVNVLESDFYELADIDVTPSKGFILRTVNPQDVPYTFGEAYTTDAFYPGELASLRDPYILRDHRGTVVEVYPFQYNPVRHVLRVYTNVTVEVVPTGPGQVNVLQPPAQPRGLSLAFYKLYSHQFLNYTIGSRYTPLDETGDMLIIAYNAWISNVQALADHKNARGIDTTIVGVSDIPGGNNATAIKAYIQDIYDSSDLAFVLLVGDGAQVDTPYASGGSADPTYSLLAGSDHYPDIMVGRFSAETVAQVDTQVERTIEYETNATTSQDWFWKGMGVASNQGPGDDGEYDNEHLDNIRLDLLAYGYTTVDQIYDPTGTAAQVTSGLNAGRGIINYTGHGSTTSWGSTGFSNSHVNALENDNMLPFICSVACVNGQFDGYTCFGEAWLRATHSGEPTGAIGAYMSSINQSWNPPMRAQDEFVDMYVSETYSSLGTLLYAGSCDMMDVYGTGGESMFDTWHLFGDPSLRVVITCPDAGTIDLDKREYACEDVAGIEVADCGLNLDDGVRDTVDVTIESDSEPAGETVTLEETESASALFTGSIPLSATDSPGVLQVGAGDTVTATYIDADDGQGGTNVTVTDTATVDCTPPNISNVQTINIEPRSAMVTFDSDEPALGTVHYGLLCDELTWTASGSGYYISPTVGLTDLDDETTYFYTVEAEDEAGNSVADDNNGDCYTFTTPPVPDYFTELFENLDNDLDNLSLIFTPDGSNDFYRGCAEAITELPTDPAGGTPLEVDDFSPNFDDGYARIDLSDEATVSIYGNTYTTFFLGTNGYVTFVHGDSTHTESLLLHFSGIPRISALYDDLDPRMGGSISWQQLTDRAVVTWEGISEYNITNSNTFQIEMYFDGTIVISYLSISVADGLAGLSEGTGLDPEFEETDLSEMDECEVFDCNNNGVPDDQDIAEGTSEDCNENEIPDECDVAEGTSADNNGNGIPDECEVAGPLVVAEGSRYLAVTPQPPDSIWLVALLVTGDPDDPKVSCVSRYVQADGRPGSDPLFQTPAAWETVHVHGEAIIPQSTYLLQAEWQHGITEAVSATTWAWCDINNDGLVSLIDIMRMIMGYQGDFTNATVENLDQRSESCEPDGIIGLPDIMAAVGAFQGESWYTSCSAPCP